MKRRWSTIGNNTCVFILHMENVHLPINNNDVQIFIYAWLVRYVKTIAIITHIDIKTNWTLKHWHHHVLIVNNCSLFWNYFTEIQPLECHQKKLFNVRIVDCQNLRYGNCYLSRIWSLIMWSLISNPVLITCITCSFTKEFTFKINRPPIPIDPLLLHANYKFIEEKEGSLCFARLWNTPWIVFVIN